MLILTVAAHLGAHINNYVHRCTSHISIKGCTHRATEGLRWLSMSIDIDTSKGLVALWEHFFVAIVAIHRNGYRWKMCFFGFD